MLLIVGQYWQKFSYGGDLETFRITRMLLLTFKIVTLKKLKYAFIMHFLFTTFTKTLTAFLTLD